MSVNCGQLSACEPSILYCRVMECIFLFLYTKKKKKKNHSVGEILSPAQVPGTMH